MRRALGGTEDALTAALLLSMVALPAGTLVARALGEGGIPRSDSLVRHANLWISFLGAAVAAREGKMLALGSGRMLGAGRARAVAGALAGAVAACVAVLLARASWELVLSERAAEVRFLGPIELWHVMLVMPVAFALLAARHALGAGTGRFGRAAGLLGIAAGAWIVHSPELLEGRSPWPSIAVLLVATVLGAPLYVAIGGAAVALFLADFTPLAAVPSEMYRLAASPYLAAVPIFTLCGFLLAEGRTPGRVLALFRAWFGWIPGGTAVVCALACTFFTVFTGGSGVTILALGGLLLPALVADGYPERFSLGLLCGSGSLGLLLPPALPLILYAIAAQVPFEDLFLGGLLPGALLVLLVAGWGVVAGRRAGVERSRFEPGAAVRALWDARWELLLPVLPLVLIFGGWATLVEAAAVTAAYAFLVQVVVRREIAVGAQLARVLRECVALLGGVMIILCVAQGLTNWMVFEQVPTKLLELVQGSITSPLVFLLCLNVFLLVVGCLMDIYSATFVVVPLILPLGAAYGIDPVHLGIIFVANLELGYLTPPVGLNLFLASYRFDRPLLAVWRAAVPMLLLLGIGVLLITYVPFLTTALLD